MSHPEESPPNAGEGRSNGPHQHHLISNTNRTARLLIWGRHSQWVCRQRSHQSFACPRCCRCWSMEQCDHPGDAQLVEAC